MTLRFLFQIHITYSFLIKHFGLLVFILDSISAIGNALNLVNVPRNYFVCNRARYDYCRIHTYIGWCIERNLGLLLVDLLFSACPQSEYGNVTDKRGAVVARHRQKGEAGSESFLEK